MRLQLLHVAVAIVICLAVLNTHEPTAFIPTSQLFAGGQDDHSLETMTLKSVPTKDGAVYVTWTNFHYTDFVANWARQLWKCGVKNIYVGAMDIETTNLMRELGIPSFAMYKKDRNHTGLTKGDFGWGSAAFTKMGRQKVALARHFLNLGVETVILCDSDVAFLRDPGPFFSRFPEPDILGHTDLLSPTIQPYDDGLEEARSVYTTVNIGLLVFRNRPQTVAFVEAWIRALEKEPTQWDQALFNQLLLQRPESLPKLESYEDRMPMVWNGSLRVGVLPTASFSSGYVAFVQHLSEKMHVPQYMVHMTFQYGGTAGKRTRLREGMLFQDPPEYYRAGSDGTEGFLSMELQWPKVPEKFGEWDESREEEMVFTHLNSMVKQLEQVKAGLAMAHALNRTFIMPKLLCLCDRYWGALSRCRMPGTEYLDLPFVCPMDHIFEPAHLNRPPLAIPWREYSFLDNPHYPKETKNTVLVLRPTEPSSVKGVPAGASEVTLPGQVDDQQLREAVIQNNHVQRMHVVNPLGLWSQFGDAQENDAFATHFLNSLSVWCCRKAPKGSKPDVRYAEWFTRTPEERTTLGWLPPPPAGRAVESVL